MQGALKKLFGGAPLLRAASLTYFLVTHLAPGMKSSGSWQVKWERNMDELVQAQIDKTNEYGFFTLSFTSVLREGFATIDAALGELEATGALGRGPS